MTVSVHQPQYLPWLGYFAKIAKSDCFVFLDKVQYKHREFQNRNKIRAQNNWLWLTVPVITKGLREQILSDVRIDNSEAWQEKHFRSIKTYYAKAAFFKEYEDFLQEVYLGRKWESLSELNVFIIKYCLKELDIKTPLYFESDLGTTEKSTARIIQICAKLKADTYLSGSGGKVYLEEQNFAQAGLKLMYQQYRHPKYRQNFCAGDNDFIPYLSIIDLLLNEGKESRGILLN